MAYQIDGTNEYNRMVVKLSPLGQLVTLGRGHKGQISLKFTYRVNFKDFLYQTLFVFSQIKDIKLV